MIKKASYLLLALLLMLSSSSFAQTKEELKASALRDAKLYSKAKVKLDYETVIKHTHPSIINGSGGKAKVLENLKTSYASFKSNNKTAYEKSNVKSVSNVVFENGEYRCLVESYDQIKKDNARTKSKNHLIGTYNDAAKIWVFFKARELKGEMGNVFFPDYKTSLDIPKDVVTRKRF